MTDENNMIATVDLGSNSFRLEICKNDNGQLQIIDSMKNMVRFAAGLNQKKILSEEAQNRALECLKIYGERLKGLKKKQVRIVATNTFRIAKNINPFIEKAQELLGFPIEIIAGKEEARLIYTGVKHSLPNDGKKILIIDIGGGSTEFTYGKNAHPDLTESISIGCVSYSKKFFTRGNVSNQIFNKALNTAIFQIQQISNKFKKLNWNLAIGTSGSAKAIRDVIIEHLNSDENITYHKMLLITNDIIKVKNINNICIKGLKQDRSEVFLGGLVIMMACFKELRISKMVVSDFALRKGVIYDLIGRTLDKDLRDETVTAFQKRYNLSLEQAKRIEDITLLLLNSIDKNYQESYKYLSWAIKLHEIGLSISHIAYHKHSSYIIENSDMPGFSKTEQYLIALIVLSHRGNLKKMKYLIENHPISWSMILCFRLAVIFCRSRIDIKLPKKIKIEKISNNSFNLIISEKWLLKNSLISNALQIEAIQWEKIKIPLFINKKN